MGHDKGDPAVEWLSGGLFLAFATIGLMAVHVTDGVPVWLRFLLFNAIFFPGMGLAIWLSRRFGPRRNPYDS